MNNFLPIAATLTGPDQRQQEILDAVRRAFVEKGFDGASMQDLAKSVGMSVGNFYRYFPSKAAIIEAIVMRDLVDIERDFSAIIGSDDPLQNMRAAIRHHIHDHQSSGDPLLWAEITAAAARKPEIASVLMRMEAEIAGYICTVLGLVAQVEPEIAQSRFKAHAALIMMLVKGSGMCAPVDGTLQDELNTLVLKTIDQILQEIAGNEAED